MKGLKYIAIAVALVPSSGMAELKQLDDMEMSSVTGQAGITIDVTSAQIDVGEINYKDEGNLYLSSTRLGGAGVAQARRGEAVTSNEMLDNLRITVDVAGDAADRSLLEGQWGLNKIGGTGLSLSGASIGDHGETALELRDGDLVIGFGAIDESELVDFGAYLDEISIAASTFGAGDGLTADRTVILSDMILEGTLGPIDIVIGGDNKSLNINSYLEGEGQMTVDFAATKFDFKIHNRRGNDVLIYNHSSGDVSFFHAQADISGSAAGLRFNLMDASGDVDLTNITIGTSPSIGNLFMTDISLSADTVVYGH